MRQRAGVFIVGAASALALCWCGGSSFSPSRGADAGDEAAADSASENVIIVGPPDASGVDGESDASCAAPTSQLCNGSCVDPTLASHCGPSCTVCPGPDSGAGQATCTAGQCTLGCSAPTSNCGGSCVDEQTDPLHCGGCSTACAVPTNGTASCAAGADGGGVCGVACVSGYHPSGAGCATTCTPNTNDPSTDPCVVATGLGTFVSPTGTDATTCGTKAIPCQSIAYAMSIAVTATKRVYACGTFTTGVVVPPGSDGLTVYGGLSCSTWAYSASTPTIVAPTGQGHALEVTGTTAGVAFEDFVFAAVSAPTTPSATPESSIAVFAIGATLTLTRVAVNAGSGQPGSGGGTSQNYSAATAPSGSAPTSLAGGTAGGPNNCQDGTTSAGGKGADVSGFASPGTPISLPSNAGASGIGNCSPGAGGTPGTPASGRGTGVTSSGTLSGAGWTPGGAGGSGNIGGIGQGGGGGGSNSGGSPGAGGGGGAGGCGGGGGTGGATGGSSIGILSFQSTVTATATTITTQSGATGGAGGPGQGGQTGGAIGAGGGSGNCGGGNGGGAGGPGGNGGAGSGGGGGAGGLSSGIVWTGTAAQEPSFNGTTYTTQAAPVSGITLGAQGPGGGNGSTPAADAVLKSN